MDRLQEEIMKTSLENMQSLQKIKYENLEIVKEIEYEKIGENVLKPCVLESVQCVGIKTSKKVPVIPPMLQKLIFETEENKGGQPAKSLATLNFKQYQTDYYGYGWCSICEKQHPVDNDNFRLISQDTRGTKKGKSVRAAHCVIKYVGGARGQITYSKPGVETFYGKNAGLTGKINLLRDLIKKSKARITEYDKLKKASTNHQQLIEDVKNMKAQIKENMIVLQSIRKQRNQIINNYKQVAESHVARRELALTYQKNKLNNKWNKFKTQKEHYYDKKKEFYEKKNKFYDKKDILYNKFKFNSFEYKRKIRENLVREMICKDKSNKSMQGGMPEIAGLPEHFRKVE
jgi:hypothetical protein